jgi:putative aldouronate transport system substrate-binding protein
MLPSAAQDVLTKVALMISSGDTTDILDVSLNAETTLNYGSNGAFLVLNKWLADPVMAPNWNKVPADEKAIMTRTVTSADGNIYAFPNYTPQNWNTTPNRLWINSAWLKKLGLKSPTTTAELKDVLIAFRDKDPNGNGRRDEIGITGVFGDTYGNDVIMTLVNSFIYWRKGLLGLDEAGNKVIAPFTDPAFRQALVYLNDLYRERVLDSAIFTNNNEQFKGVLNMDPMTVGLISVGSHSGLFPGMATYDNKNYDQMDLIAPLKGPNGVAWSPYYEQSGFRDGYVFASSKYKEESFKLLESFMDVEVAIISRWGQEGVDFSRKPEDKAKYRDRAARVIAGIYPDVTLVILNDTWTKPNNSFWRLSNPCYIPIEYHEATANTWTPPYDPADKNNAASIFHGIYYPDAHPKFTFPENLNYSLDEATKIAETVTNINTALDQYMAEFITGVRDISSNAAWNDYIAEFNKMGLQQWIDVAQTAYNRSK